MLAGCGGKARPSSRRAGGAGSGSGDADVGLLNSALAVEQQAIAAYTAAGPLLSGVAQHAAGRFLGQELRHAGILRELIKQAGGRPHQPRAHYDLGHPRGARALLALLHELEQRQLAAYLRAIPLVSSPELRQRLASILANDAQHVTVLRGELSLPVLTAPLLTAAE